MNQTPAAILILAASVLSYAAHAASVTAHTQSSIVLTLLALLVGLSGGISLLAACFREREMLIDSNARLDMLDRVMVREPLRALKEVARPVVRPQRSESRRQLEISAEVQARLNALAHLEGRDRSEILEETLRKHLPDFDQSRVA